MSEQLSDAAFEQWYATHAFDYAASPVGSRDCALQRAAWAAGRRAAIEECAKVCDDAGATMNSLYRGASGEIMAAAASRCALSIRALAHSADKGSG